MPSLEGLLSGRFLVGLSMGMEGSIHSMYVCELTSKTWRGPFASSGVLVITLGILAIFVMGSFIPWKVNIVKKFLIRHVIAVYLLNSNQSVSNFDLLLFMSNIN